MDTVFAWISFFVFGAIQFPEGLPVPKADGPSVCFTFDDGQTRDFPGYKNSFWNNEILRILDEANTRAVFFVRGKLLDSPEGKKILHLWDSAGHWISNHTWSHWNYARPAMTFTKYKADVLKNDSLIRQFQNFHPLFRFPYLKEGASEATRDSMRDFLDEKNYRNGYVTIDASDWYYCDRLVKALTVKPDLDLDPWKDAFVDHIMNRAAFYDSLGRALTGRSIHHSLLLHHNLTSALFLDDLIKAFQDKGWRIAGPDETYADEVYSERPATIPAGESLIWSLAKQSGNFEKVLRYPAEDGAYEKEKVDGVENK